MKGPPRPNPGSLDCLEQQEKEGEATPRCCRLSPGSSSGRRWWRRSWCLLQQNRAEPSWLSGRPQKPPPLTLRRRGRRREEPPCGHDASLQHRTLSFDGGDCRFRYEIHNWTNKSINWILDSRVHEYFISLNLYYSVFNLNQNRIIIVVCCYFYLPHRTTSRVVIYPGKIQQY